MAYSCLVRGRLLNRILESKSQPLYPTLTDSLIPVSKFLAFIPVTTRLGGTVILSTLEEASTLVIMVTIPLPLHTQPRGLLPTAVLPAPAVKECSK